MERLGTLPITLLISVTKIQCHHYLSQQFLIRVFKHYPVNVVVPMHLSHYDIICSILSKSKIGKEMYIYDNADIILSEFMFSRWDSALKNQTEYNRLKNGGITKVGNTTRGSRTVRTLRILNLRVLISAHFESFKDSPDRIDSHVRPMKHYIYKVLTFAKDRTLKT